MVGEEEQRESPYQNEGKLHGPGQPECEAEEIGSSAKLRPTGETTTPAVRRNPEVRLLSQKAVQVGGSFVFLGRTCSVKPFGVGLKNRPSGSGRIRNEASKPIIQKANPTARSNISMKRALRIRNANARTQARCEDDARCELVGHRAVACGALAMRDANAAPSTWPEAGCSSLACQPRTSCRHW